MIFLIDIGNTRIKWAQLVDGDLGEQSAIAHAQLTAPELHEAMLTHTPRPQRVLASNVGGARAGELTSECVGRAWGLEIEFVQSSASAGGVRNAYRDPAKLGVDRWLALIGAHALERAAACVVSVGTAMTIDALDAQGRHYGGLITPGPELMISSLFSGTSEIAQRAASGESSLALFADNTRTAVEQGAVQALAALVDRAVAGFSREINERPTLLVTGGAGSRITPALQTPHRLVADLVLRGLAVLAGAR